MKEKTSLDPIKCCKFVGIYTINWYRGERQCSRKWTVTAKDGKHYCKQHNPKAEQARKKLRSDLYHYDTAKRAMGYFGNALYDALQQLVGARDKIALEQTRKILKTAQGYRELLNKGKP